LSQFLRAFLFVVLLNNVVTAQDSGFGSLASDRGKPMQFISDSLIYNREENVAELFDEVEVRQGNSVLSAHYIKAVYSKTDNKLEQIFAERNVELKSDKDIARADKATYSLSKDVISLTGNAHLIQGGNNIFADQILINTKTGLTELLGSVKTVIVPSKN